jgi:hypothetical protein
MTGAQLGLCSGIVTVAGFKTGGHCPPSAGVSRTTNSVLTLGRSLIVSLVGVELGSMLGPGFDVELGGSFAGRLDAPAKLVIERASYPESRHTPVGLALGRRPIRVQTARNGLR